MSRKNDQIYQALKNDLHTGRLLPGEKLPRGIELAERFGVAHLTIRRVLERMRNDGYLEIRKGVGIFAMPQESSQQVLMTNGYLVDIHALFPRPVQTALSRAGYVFRLFDHRQLADTPQRARELFKLHHDFFLFDGLAEYPWQLLDMVPEGTRRIAYNRYERPDPPEEMAMVLFDAEHAGYAAARLLLDNGRRRLAVLTGQQPWPCSNICDFIAGARRAAAEAGDAECRIVHDMPLSGEAMHELLLGKERCDGIFGTIDAMLLPVVNAAGKYKLRIPEDLSLIGLGNTPWAKTHGFTTIDMRADSMAGEILKVMTQKIPRKVMVKGQLVIRESCPAAAAQRKHIAAEDRQPRIG